MDLVEKWKERFRRHRIVRRRRPSDPARVSILVKAKILRTRSSLVEILFLGEKKGLWTTRWEDNGWSCDSTRLTSMLTDPPPRTKTPTADPDPVESCVSSKLEPRLPFPYRSVRRSNLRSRRGEEESVSQTAQKTDKKPDSRAARHAPQNLCSPFPRSLYHFLARSTLQLEHRPGMSADK